MASLKRIGSQTLDFQSRPSVLSWASVGGKKEKEGPLGKEFDILYEDPMVNCESFEEGESALQCAAIDKALEKVNLHSEDIDIMFGGDLLNQCIASNYAVGSFKIPFLGLYGACSTMAESLLLSAIAIDGGFCKKTIAVTSSHFCSAERQFRFPLNYGGQRTPPEQWTVTGSGAVIVSNEMKGKAYIKRAVPGKIVDLGVTDINNMGAAMAPAAYDTLSVFFKDTNTKPSDYDRILTGDLGSLGSGILRDLMNDDSIDLGERYTDCGCLIYNAKEQDVHAGGSGCGCSASVLCSHILKRVESGELKNVIFMATGALMSPTSIFQGKTIPAVAHLIHITNGRDS